MRLLLCKVVPRIRDVREGEIIGVRLKSAQQARMASGVPVAVVKHRPVQPEGGRDQPNPAVRASHGVIVRVNGEGAEEVDRRPGAGWLPEPTQVQLEILGRPDVRVGRVAEEHVARKPLLAASDKPWAK